MAAKVLQGRFGPQKPSLEAEILETLVVTSAIELIEAFLEFKPARPEDPTTYFLRSLLCAARWEIENAIVGKICREDRELAILAWATAD